MTSTKKDPVLAVLQLSGGNDALNTIVPYSNPLYADTRRGRRPSFINAASTDLARTLFNYTVGLLRGTGLRVETGQFQSQMSLSLCNEGQVTIMLDSNDMK